MAINNSIHAQKHPLELLLEGQRLFLFVEPFGEDTESSGGLVGASGLDAVWEGGSRDGGLVGGPPR